jgi:hypothetical protein
MVPIAAGMRKIGAWDLVLMEKYIAFDKVAPLCCVATF